MTLGLHQNSVFINILNEWILKVMSQLKTVYGNSKYYKVFKYKFERGHLKVLVIYHLLFFQVYFHTFIPAKVKVSR